MPRVSDAKEKLTQAALGLIWTSGYGATSVDDICAKANVKKGSFYHFFKSKADLECAALEAHWQRNKAVLNEIFSPTTPPLQRLEEYFDMILRRQGELELEYGSVVGCPLCSVGSEVSCQEATIRDKTLQVMECYVKFLESAIRDAHAEGSLVAPEPKCKARCLYAYVQGLLTQCRIAGNLRPLQELKTGAWAMLGRAQPVGAAA